MTVSLSVLEHNALTYRRTWRGSVLVSFISPVFFLTAMGLGLGSLVNRGAGGIGGVPYRDFLAPGLLVAAAMQTAAIEMTYPIMAKVYWQRTYEAMLATPLRVRDLLVGEVSWISVRLAMVATLFFMVMGAFGTIHSAWALLALPAAVLTGLAFAAPILAYSATQTRDSGFSVIQRFIVNPLFLFAGTFFPIERLPLVLQVVANVSPLYHGIQLARGLSLGTLRPAAALLHLAVLAAYILAGVAAAAITLQRRLVK